LLGIQTLREPERLQQRHVKLLRSVDIACAQINVVEKTGFHVLPFDYLLVSGILVESDEQSCIVRFDDDVNVCHILEFQFSFPPNSSSLVVDDNTVDSRKYLIFSLSNYAWIHHSDSNNRRVNHLFIKGNRDFRRLVSAVPDNEANDRLRRRIKN